VERLLSISGEDMLSIDRKYREAWTGTLPTRIMLLSNELPRFGDASGAIADRFVITRLTRSWLGKEDSRLTAGLLTELPGILNWALNGLARLDRTGRLAEPSSSAQISALLHDIVSPVSAFAKDRCITSCRHEPSCEHEVIIGDLYLVYRQWCAENGHHPESKNVWSQKMLAAFPGITHARAPRQWEPPSGSALNAGAGASRPWLWKGIRMRSATWPYDPEDDDEPRQKGPQSPTEQKSGEAEGACTANNGQVVVDRVGQHSPKWLLSSQNDESTPYGQHGPSLDHAQGGPRPVYEWSATDEDHGTPLTCDGPGGPGGPGNSGASYQQTPERPEAPPPPSSICPGACTGPLCNDCQGRLADAGLAEIAEQRAADSGHVAERARAMSEIDGHFRVTDVQFLDRWVGTLPARAGSEGQLRILSGNDGSGELRLLSDDEKAPR
jgi:hypothetical protein